MKPVVLVRGREDGLRADAVRSLVDDVVGDVDRALAVNEFAGDEYTLGEAVDAALTLPFLTEHRVVVVRNAARFARVDDLTPLLDYLAEPSPTTALVLAWEPGADQGRLGAPPKKLLDAIKGAGGDVIDPDPGGGKARSRWVDQQLDASALHLDREARDRISDRLGDDIDRVGGVLATLESTFGPGADLGAEDVESFLGEAGTVPPWELTDAIDAGDRTAALDRLHRMTGAGGMHPLQVMAMLHTHFGRVLRLDGADAADEKAAASLLGMKGSTFPARKALNQARRLGNERVRRAIELLADADLDLRGRTAWPEDTVMEVLVARLAHLSRR